MTISRWEQFFLEDRRVLSVPLSQAVEATTVSTTGCPRYAYDRCIRCYCCQEMCPERAIERRTPFLGRLLRLG